MSKRKGKGHCCEEEGGLIVCLRLWGKISFHKKGKGIPRGGRLYLAAQPQGVSYDKLEREREQDLGRLPNIDKGKLSSNVSASSNIQP